MRQNPIAHLEGSSTFQAWWVAILLLVSMTVNFMDRLVLLAGMGILGANVLSNMQITVITNVFPSSAQARVTSLTGVGEGVMNMAMNLSTGFLVDHFSFLPVFITAAALPAAAMWGLFYWVRKCRPIWPKDSSPVQF